MRETEYVVTPQMQLSSAEEALAFVAALREMGATHVCVDGLCSVAFSPPRAVVTAPDVEPLKKPELDERTGFSDDELYGSVD